MSKDIIETLRRIQCSDAACGNLQIAMGVKLAIYEIKRLRLERDEAKSKVERIMSGLEGTCMTCEPVGVRNQQMQRDIATLKAQRNVARREVCRSRASCIQGKSPLHIAEALGWDCFADQNADTSEHL